MIDHENHSDGFHEESPATGRSDGSALSPAAETLSWTAQYGAQGITLQDAPVFLDDRSLTLDTSVRRLEFLSNFTEARGLVSSFDCGSKEQRAMFVECLAGDVATGRDMILAEKCQQIVTAIKNSLESLAKRRSGVTAWSQSIQLACDSFFTSPRLANYLNAYWALWHPNCPIIHKPTFNVQASPAMLLAVMALLGACLSPVPGDRESALMWLDAVEEWVFSAPEFSDDPLQPHPGGEHSSTLRKRLDALRTAYCVVLLQTWEGNDTAKRRVGRSRYTDVIGVFRSVCDEDISHGNLSYYVASEEAWKAFALTEELIRTLTYVVLLDTAYVIFNNTPPRMAPGEARVVLTCPEACFQADSVQAWTSALQLWQSSSLGQNQPLIHQATSILWKESLTQSDRDMLCSMSSLNFFTLVHPLHVELFHARCHPLPASQTALVRRALDAWRAIWLDRTGIEGLEELPPSRAADCWKRLGFAGYAPEFWCLADIVLNSSESVALNAYDRCGGHASSSSITQLLSRYDVSDMSQVHKLVDLFGSMQLAA
ncbi:hypothetical protein Slin15195_G077110 [Septoria linicola]|uniref:Xylanolytic transcriptional activator regulatory domain-containing protein n=1 Tax=Septoria linicola TaxID=215465 RepID=A0A9Q9ELH3_9PEZI|nr:hypothetical protein Slin14017_G038280 [Septoria linicola]USW54392.1 hypothetical protein Slin15195_G077110 [Septoria linicola]